MASVDEISYVAATPAQLILFWASPPRFSRAPAAGLPGTVDRWQLQFAPTWLGTWLEAGEGSDALRVPMAVLCGLEPGQRFRVRVRAHTRAPPSQDGGGSSGGRWGPWVVSTVDFYTPTFASGGLVLPPRACAPQCAALSSYVVAAGAAQVWVGSALTQALMRRPPPLPLSDSTLPPFAHVPPSDAHGVATAAMSSSLALLQLLLLSGRLPCPILPLRCFRAATPAAAPLMAGARAARAGFLSQALIDHLLAPYLAADATAAHMPSSRPRASQRRNESFSSSSDNADSGDEAAPAFTPASLRSPVRSALGRSRYGPSLSTLKTPAVMTSPAAAVATSVPPPLVEAAPTSVFAGISGLATVSAAVSPPPATAPAVTINRRAGWLPPVDANAEPPPWRSSATPSATPAVETVPATAEALPQGRSPPARASVVQAPMRGGGGASAPASQYLGCEQCRKALFSLGAMRDDEDDAEPPQPQQRRTGRGFLCFGCGRVLCRRCRCHTLFLPSVADGEGSQQGGVYGSGSDEEGSARDAGARETGRRSRGGKPAAAHPPLLPSSLVQVRLCLSCVLASCGLIAEAEAAAEGRHGGNAPSLPPAFLLLPHPFAGGDSASASIQLLPPHASGALLLALSLSTAVTTALPLSRKGAAAVTVLTRAPASTASAPATPSPAPSPLTLLALSPTASLNNAWSGASLAATPSGETGGGDGVAFAAARWMSPRSWQPPVLLRALNRALLRVRDEALEQQAIGRGALYLAQPRTIPSLPALRSLPLPVEAAAAAEEPPIPALSPLQSSENVDVSSPLLSHVSPRRVPPLATPHVHLLSPVILEALAAGGSVDVGGVLSSSVRESSRSSPSAREFLPTTETMVQSSAEGGDVAVVVVHGNGRVDLPPTVSHPAAALKELLTSCGSLLEYIVMLQAHSRDVEGTPLVVHRKPSVAPGSRTGSSRRKVGHGEPPEVEAALHPAAAIGLVTEGKQGREGGGGGASLSALAKQARMDITREPGVLILLPPTGGHRAEEAAVPPSAVPVLHTQSPWVTLALATSSAKKAAVAAASDASPSEAPAPSSLSPPSGLWYLPMGDAFAFAGLESALEARIALCFDVLCGGLLLPCGLHASVGGGDGSGGERVSAVRAGTAPPVPLRGLIALIDTALREAGPALARVDAPSAAAAFAAAVQRALRATVAAVKDCLIVALSRTHGGGDAHAVTHDIYSGPGSACAPIDELTRGGGGMASLRPTPRKRLILLRHAQPARWPSLGIERSTIACAPPLALMFPPLPEAPTPGALMHTISSFSVAKWTMSPHTSVGAPALGFPCLPLLARTCDIYQVADAEDLEGGTWALLRTALGHAMCLQGGIPLEGTRLAHAVDAGSGDGVQLGAATSAPNPRAALEALARSFASHLRAGDASNMAAAADATLAACAGRWLPSLVDVHDGRTLNISPVGKEAGELRVHFVQATGLGGVALGKAPEANDGSVVFGHKGRNAAVAAAAAARRAHERSFLSRLRRFLLRSHAAGEGGAADDAATAAAAAAVGPIVLAAALQRALAHRGLSVAGEDIATVIASEVAAAVVAAGLSSSQLASRTSASAARIRVLPAGMSAQEAADEAAMLARGGGGVGANESTAILPELSSLARVRRYGGSALAKPSLVAPSPLSWLSARSWARLPSQEVPSASAARVSPLAALACPDGLLTPLLQQLGARDGSGASRGASSLLPPPHVYAIARAGAAESETRARALTPCDGEVGGVSDEGRGSKPGKRRGAGGATAFGVPVWGEGLSLPWDGRSAIMLSLWGVPPGGGASAPNSNGSSSSIGASGGGVCLGTEAVSGVGLFPGVPERHVFPLQTRLLVRLPIRHSADGSCGCGRGGGGGGEALSPQLPRREGQRERASSGAPSSRASSESQGSSSSEGALLSSEEEAGSEEERGFDTGREEARGATGAPLTPLNSSRLRRRGGVARLPSMPKAFVRFAHSGELEPLSPIVGGAASVSSEAPLYCRWVTEVVALQTGSVTIEMYYWPRRNVWVRPLTK